MPQYILFRPPRRQPKILAISCSKDKVALVILDPWELRYVGEHELENPLSGKGNKIAALLLKTICRERPNAVAVKQRGELLRLLRKLTRKVKLPLLCLPAGKVKETGGIFKNFSPSGGSAPLKEVLAKPLIAKTLQLAQAALIHFITRFYDAHR